MPRTSPIAWDFGDGSAAQIGRSVSHTFADNGAYTVSVHITGGGLDVTEGRAITVGSVVPTMTITTSSFVREGRPATIRLSGPTDVAADVAGGFTLQLRLRRRWRL